MTQMKNPVVREAISRKLKRLLKRARFIIAGSQGNALPIFVMGYGRSGTTMLLDVFEHDLRVDVLGENDPRIAHDHMLVHSRVAPAISASRAKVIVMKPILDSFSVCELLQDHPTARVIWAFRLFEPVVASALKKFGTSVADELREVVVNNSGDGWLRRGIPDSTLRQLRRLDNSNFGPNDWMALVWWSVNLTLLSHGLIDSERLLLVKYEDLVRDPDDWMRKIYGFIDLPYRRGATEWIISNSATKQIRVEITREVRQLCEELVANIDQAAKQAPDFTPKRSIRNSTLGDLT